MAEVTISDLGRKVKFTFGGGGEGTLGGKRHDGWYLIHRTDDGYGWGLDSSCARHDLSVGNYALNLVNFWVNSFEYLNQPKETAPSFKFNIGDIVVLNNKGHQGQNPERWGGPHTSCASDNAFAFESGAKIIKREFYPKEGRNWYQIEHNSLPYDNWISEDGLELFVAKPSESSYTYKVGDVIRFKDTPNTRKYREGASIGKTYTITGKEESDGVRSINAVEAGIEDCWTSDGNKWGTNFKKGDIELVSEAKYDTWSGSVVIDEPLGVSKTTQKLDTFEWADLYKDRSDYSTSSITVGAKQSEIIPEKSVQPSSTDIVYISKQKTKHKLLTF